jgi:hypothetical protein
LSAEATAFAGNGIDFEVLYRLKAADCFTYATASAKAFVYEGSLPTPELCSLLNLRLEQKVEVRSIHITVSQNFALGQGSKGSHDTCLSRPPFTA